MSPNGFEPLTFCVLGKRDNQLHQGDEAGKKVLWGGLVSGR